MIIRIDIQRDNQISKSHLKDQKDNIVWTKEMTSFSFLRTLSGARIYRYLLSNWAPSSEEVPTNMREMHGFRSSCACEKLHPGLHTFCNIQWFGQRTVTALIRLRTRAVWSGPSLSAYARGHVFAMRRPKALSLYHLISVIHSNMGSQRIFDESRRPSSAATIWFIAVLPVNLTTSNPSSSE